MCTTRLRLLLPEEPVTDDIHVIHPLQVLKHFYLKPTGGGGTYWTLMSDFEFWTLMSDFGFWILDTNVRIWILDTNVRFWILDTSVRYLDFGH